jgi:hypothetical protein
MDTMFLEIQQPLGKNMNPKLDNSPPTSENSILLKTIETYFNLSELKRLCFDMSIDHEIFSQIKIDMARDLIEYSNRHNRTSELKQKIMQLRPHAGFKLQNFVKAHILPENADLQELDSLLSQLRHYSEKVYEWKELHNYLDVIISIFGQYLAQTERLAKIAESKNIDLLNSSWQPVSLQIERLLHWSENDILHIGKPFKALENGDLIGESWAIDSFKFMQSRKIFLREYPSTDYEEERFLLKAIMKLQQQNLQKRSCKNWWRRLLDHTREFDNTLKKHLFLADKELRKSAEDLYLLSKETLWTS